MGRNTAPKQDEKKTEQQQDTKDTTMKIDSELKGLLDGLKVDEEESYKSVIRRLVEGKTPMESTQDTKHIAIPDKAYRLLMMMLPDNMKEVVRKGVR
jgi:hypothetical protein